MNSKRSSFEDSKLDPGEIEAMAGVLEAKHGQWAAEVAEFFSIFHCMRGDTGRGWAWDGVAQAVREREQDRLGQL